MMGNVDAKDVNVKGVEFKVVIVKVVNILR